MAPVHHYEDGFCWMMAGVIGEGRHHGEHATIVARDYEWLPYVIAHFIT